MLILLAALLSALSAHSREVSQLRPALYGSAKGMKCPIQIEPGKAIGQIHLGQTRAEVKKLGLAVHTVSGLSDSLLVGVYSVTFSDDKVSHIELELADAPACIRIGKQKIAKTTSVEALAKILPHCQKEEARYGGNLTQCEGVSLGTGGWGGAQKSPAIRVD